MAFLLMGNGLQGTLLPLRAQLATFSTMEIGILGSSYFLGFALGCLRGAAVIQRVGHIRAFTAMVSVASTIALAHVLILDPGVWWPLRAVTGFCFACLFMIIESWLNERATNQTRGLVFSVYTIINLTVITIGQMMITLAPVSGFTLFALASILVSLAAVPVALTRSPPPAPVQSVRIRFKHLYRLSPVGFVGIFVVGMTNGSFWSLAPVFAENLGLATSQIAIFMSVTVLGGAVGQWPLGRASDRMDRRRVIIIACTLAAIAGVSMDLTNHYWPPAVFLCAFFFGMFTFCLYALCAAHLNDFVEKDGFVEAASGLLLVFAGGAILGPLIASGLMRYWSNDGLFAFTAAAQASMAVFAFIRTRKRTAVAQEDRTKFADAIRVVQTVSTVDPTAEQKLSGTPRTSDKEKPAEMPSPEEPSK